MSRYCYLLLDGEKIGSNVHPDAIITECYTQIDGTRVHVVLGQEEEEKLLQLQKHLDEEMT